MRADVIARQFLDGASVADLAYDYECTLMDIEQCLRRHLERLLAKKRRSKR